MKWKHLKTIQRRSLLCSTTMKWKRLYEVSINERFGFDNRKFSRLWSHWNRSHQEIPSKFACGNLKVKNPLFGKNSVTSTCFWFSIRHHTSHKMGGLVPMRIVTIFVTKRKAKSKQGRISNLIGPWTNQSQSRTNQKYVTRWCLFWVQLKRKNAKTSHFICMIQTYKQVILEFLEFGSQEWHHRH